MEGVPKSAKDWVRLVAVVILAIVAIVYFKEQLPIGNFSKVAYLLGLLIAFFPAIFSFQSLKPKDLKYTLGCMATAGIISRDSCCMTARLSISAASPAWASARFASGVRTT